MGISIYLALKTKEKAIALILKPLIDYIIYLHIAYGLLEDHPFFIPSFLFLINMFVAEITNLNGTVFLIKSIKM
jgi:hypothetical protein